MLSQTGVDGVPGLGYAPSISRARKEHMSDRPAEKRRNRRVPSDLRISPEGMQEMDAVNLSAGGAYCLSRHPIDQMTRLDVRFHLPGEAAQPLRARAVVVRVEQGSASGIGPPYRLALWFQGMSVADRLRLRRFLGEDDDH